MNRRTKRCPVTVLVGAPLLSARPALGGGGGSPRSRLGVGLGSHRMPTQTATYEVHPTSRMACRPPRRPGRPERAARLPGGSSGEHA